MRKYALFIALFATSLAFATTIRGVSRGDYHFGYISASAGFSSLTQNVPNVTTRGSWAALLGAGYEFRMNHAWVSVGAQFMQEQSTTTPDEYIWNSPVGGWDDERDPIDYYQYTISQQDKQLFRTLDIPLMAGYYNSGFYIGAGLKAGFSIASTITTSGSYDLGAKYTDGLSVIQHVDGGPYHIYPSSEKKYNCALRPQLALIGEIGYDLLSSLMSNSTVCHMLKIGFYAEVGLRSVRPDDSMDPIQLQDMNFLEAARKEMDVTKGQITPYYLNSQTAGKHIAPYYVGIKLTYLIGGSWSATKTWHKGCQCYE